jgi:hypothetical protein
MFKFREKKKMSEVFDNSPNANPVPLEERVPLELPADRDIFGQDLSKLRAEAKAEAPAAGGSDPRVLVALEAIGARLDKIEKALFMLLTK